jgi:rhamnosyl/mannosyltransferase
MMVVQTNKAYAPLVGGIEKTITNLAEGLCMKDGINVQVLVCNHERSLRTVRREMNGVPVTYVPTWGLVASLPISPSYLGSLIRMRGDILHIHEPFPLADLSVLTFPAVAKHFSKIVVTWHSDIVRQRWAMRYYGPLVRRFLRRVDRILVSSPNLIAHSEYLSPMSDRCEVIPLGVKMEWVHQSGTRTDRVEQIRCTYGTPLLLFVGRLVYYKGIRYLVEALAMIPGARLVMIGSGPLKGELLRQVERLGLRERVTIIPPVSEEELHAFYEACDMLVLPSIERSEAYGLVQVEAMASGKPVVSTRLDTGVPFVNQHRVTGLTVPMRDARALADAISLLIRDTDLRVRLGQQARDRALREFSAEMMVERTIDVYRRLLA